MYQIKPEIVVDSQLKLWLLTYFICYLFGQASLPRVSRLIMDVAWQGFFKYFYMIWKWFVMDSVD